MAFVDDRRHAVLSRARPSGQARVESPDRHARDAYGNVSVLEVTARSALHPFLGMGARAFPVWALNPYVGCTHGCSYCYVPDSMKVERTRWGTYVVAKEGLTRHLARELATRPAGTVYLSTGTDPYQPVEAERRLTRACLRLLARADWPLEVLTRSPLVARDTELLSAFTDAAVGLSIPTLDDDLRRALEPGAPPVAARLAALRGLADAGLPVYANYCPAVPFTPGAGPADVAASFADAGVRWVNTAAWKYQATTRPGVAARLRGHVADDVLDRFADARSARRTHEALRRALQRRGIPLRTGFFNQPRPADPRRGRTRDGRPWRQAVVAT